MSKMTGAIYEIHQIDEIAQRKNWINDIHPLIKLIVTIGYILCVVSFHKYDLTGLIIMAVYPASLFILGDLSFLGSIRKLRIVLPLVCAVGIWNPFFDKQPMMLLGAFTITGGMISMVTLMLKGILSVLASYLFIATTTIEKICYALKLLHVPTILVTQILLTYRYISILLSEANRIMTAYLLRAPGQKGIHFKVWGSLAGQLLLGSMDRASRVYESMSLRGYNGTFYFRGKKAIGKNDIFYLLIWILIIGVLRMEVLL